MRINKIIAFVLCVGLILFIQCISAQTMSVANTKAINADDTMDSIILKAAHIVPTPNQYAALQDEFIAFIHFGPNTFTRKEWGNGMEDPAIFNLQNLDTDQWCRAIQAAGMTKIILTAKHHDGFVLWQSRYTKHGIMSSPYKQGDGDILKELAASCAKYDLKLGIYLSPADLYQIESPEGLYGNLSEYTERIIPSPVANRPFENKTTFTFEVDDYNEYFLNQLFEVLTEYGPIHEVWFDGAHPKRKGGQQYNYLAWKELIRTLVPEAVIFGREDIRWCGNESGGTRETEWNVIPYPDDPHQMNHFSDLTNPVLGSPEMLAKGEFLHYQPAETNTSIRAGWFYRDDTYQDVRSADDVYDMYERSVGGNSIFLLNIPPNRNGQLSPTDVSVLEEVGRRIRSTYGEDLFKGADGPEPILDGKDETLLLLDRYNQFEINTDQPITLNRLILQEAILTHSERVAKFRVDAWIHESWKEIATSTNIGYKRILRFPEITTAKIRVTILDQRYIPAISNVSAHYYRPQPPQLAILRDSAGLVKIIPQQNAFSWKPHRENFLKNINVGIDIRYTTDGSAPDRQSAQYSNPFFLPSGTVRATAFTEDQAGSETRTQFGYLPVDWKLLGSGQSGSHLIRYATDSNLQTYWQSSDGAVEDLYFQIKLDQSKLVTGFFYTPPLDFSDGMIEAGRILISQDGQNWKELDHFEFGNLINDPSRRRHQFKKANEAAYIKLIPSRIAGHGSSIAIAEFEIY